MAYHTEMRLSRLDGKGERLPVKVGDRVRYRLRQTDVLNLGIVVGLRRSRGSETATVEFNPYNRSAREDVPGWAVESVDAD